MATVVAMATLAAAAAFVVARMLPSGTAASPQIAARDNAQRGRNGASRQTAARQQRVPGPIQAAVDWEDDAIDAYDPQAAQDAPRTRREKTRLTSAEEAEGEVARIEQDLADDGSTYFVVEPLDDRSDRYECRCLMKLSSRSNYSRAFAAEADTPEKAAAEVQRQVKLWRQARSGR